MTDNDRTWPELDDLTIKINYYDHYEIPVCASGFYFYMNCKHYHWNDRKCIQGVYP